MTVIAEKPQPGHILPPLIKGGLRGHSPLIFKGGLRGVMAPGFKAAGISCNIKKTGAKDLAIILSATPAYCAGMFTRNRVKAAPVLIDMERVKSGRSMGILVNSGNANACTGKAGFKAALDVASFFEKRLGLKKGELLIASTGVIGVPLPVDKIQSGAERLIKGLSPQGLGMAAEAIMTTDAFSKSSAMKADIGGKTVTVAGIAKGAGMICPDMATMLAFFMTDANIKGPALKAALRESVDKTFNSIMVDNDTSTNDTVLVLANGLSKGPEIKKHGPHYRAFTGLLTDTAKRLARMIIEDGEGATKFIEINVRGAANDKEAKAGARAVGQSMLVKCAFFGADPNWGRILCAIGKSGVRLREDKADILLNNVQVVRNGLDTGREKQAAKALKTKNVRVEVDLGAGSGVALLWTTDLSYEYVKINSAYRT